MGDTQVEVFMELRAQHAEGPLWDAETACLWWVDITAERVHCSDPSRSIDISWATPGQPGGVVLSTSGDPVVATPASLAVLDRVTGSTDLRVSVERDRPENRANDIKVDSQGRAWVGTMPFDKRPRNAALYRVDGGEVRCVVDGLTISNGPALDEVRRCLYLADTALCVVDGFDLDPEAGEISGRRRFLDFSEVQIWPDGGDLYITTSWTDCDQRANQPLAGAISRCRPGVSGPPSPRFADQGPPLTRVPKRPPEKERTP